MRIILVCVIKTGCYSPENKKKFTVIQKKKIHRYTKKSGTKSVLVENCFFIAKNFY